MTTSGSVTLPVVGGGGGGIASINGNTVAAQVIAGGSGISVASSAGTTTITNTGSAADWSLTGNAGTSGTNFIGTTDNENWYIKWNDLIACTITEYSGQPIFAFPADAPSNLFFPGLSGGASGFAVMGTDGFLTSSDRASSFYAIQGSIASQNSSGVGAWMDSNFVYNNALGVMGIGRDFGGGDWPVAAGEFQGQYLTVQPPTGLDFYFDFDQAYQTPLGDGTSYDLEVYSGYYGPDGQIYSSSADSTTISEGFNGTSSLNLAFDYSAGSYVCNGQTITYNVYPSYGSSQKGGTPATNSITDTINDGVTTFQIQGSFTATAYNPYTYFVNCSSYGPYLDTMDSTTFTDDGTGSAFVSGFANNAMSFAFNANWTAPGAGPTPNVYEMFSTALFGSGNAIQSTTTSAPYDFASGDGSPTDISNQYYAVAAGYFNGPVTILNIGTPGTVPLLVSGTIQCDQLNAGSGADINVANISEAYVSSDLYLQNRGSHSYGLIGSATLASGTVTVANPAAYTTSVIVVSYGAVAGSTGALAVTAISNNTSFTIKSYTPGTTTVNAADHSVVNYHIIQSF